MRRGVLLSTVLIAFAVVPVATSLAASPYTVNMTIQAHKAIEFDPGFLVDAEPCFVTTADVTEVFNGEAHVLTAGIDDDGNFIPPLHFEKTVEESLLVVPDDPTLPTYTGHSTVHLRNFENSPNAGFTNTITLRGTDGSHLLFHEDQHMLVKASGIDLTVDHAHASC
jgi:hypothetical protein